MVRAGVGEEPSSSLAAGSVSLSLRLCLRLSQLWVWSKRKKVFWEALYDNGL